MSYVPPISKRTKDLIKRVGRSTGVDWKIDQEHLSHNDVLEQILLILEKQNERILKLESKTTHQDNA